MLNLERRSAPRIDLRADASVTLNGDSWSGTLRNASLGGLYIVFPSTLPVVLNQPIQLGLVSDIGVLEITGRIITIRDVPEPDADRADAPWLGLGIKFAPVAAMEGQILQSILDAVAERSITLRLNALLPPQDTGDLLLEVHAQGLRPADATPVHHPASDPDETAPPERRLTSRGSLSIPVSVKEKLDAAPARELTGQAIDIGLGGMNLRMQARPEAYVHPLLLQFALPGTGDETVDCTVPAEVVWTAPDPVRDELRLGLRFPYLDDDTRLRITALVSKLMASLEETEAGAGRRLASDPLECRNPRGQRLALYHDHRRDALPSGTPVVIIAPGYGETKKEHIALAYHLAINGFHVLRYDHSNHVGESDGEIRDTSLGGMQQDLLAVVDFASTQWPASEVAVITTSLAGRVALKAAACDHRITLLVLLAGVVDVQATLRAVHQEDLIGTHLRGMRRGLTNVLGLNVDLDQWLEDAVTQGFADLQTTLRDARQVRTPVSFFVPEHDAWVSLESVKMVHAALQAEDKHLYMIPEALHRLNENPRKARAVFRQLAACCLDHFFPDRLQTSAGEPSRREIGLQGRLERERARAQHQMAKTENVEFWRDYLDQFHYIVNFSDYWGLLDHIYRQLGPLDGQARVLDAGCGNGNFGMFLMINQAYSRRHAAPLDQPPLRYVGMDFVFSALKQARRNFANVAVESVAPLASALAMPAPIVSALTLADLNMPLPFSDNHFDCIVSNLVIGYLLDPLSTLRELMRVLAPHGKLVVTNLKPQADLSQIYRNFVQRTERPEEVDEARRLLNNSGKIKLGESDGIFRFFDRQELATLLICSGAQQPRIYSTFANQAFIAVANKPSPAYRGAFAEDNRLSLPQIQA